MLQEMLKNAPNVLMNKILLQGKEIEGSTYEDLVKGQVAQGFTPMTWLTTQIFDAQDLPEGSLQHLLDSSEEIRPRLKEFFMEFLKFCLRSYQRSCHQTEDFRTSTP